MSENEPKALVVRRVILLDVKPADFSLAIRAAEYLLAQFIKDAIVACGDGVTTATFYVKRNKASITVRPC